MIGCGVLLNKTALKLQFTGAGVYIKAAVYWNWSIYKC
jgi:hypothetical protein